MARFIAPEQCLHSILSSDFEVGLERLVLRCSGVEQYKRRGPAFVEPRLFFNCSSQLDLLRDAKCVVDLDSQVAHGAFELGMSQ